jgi:glycosyltransferase involved in cell wall biosynthesis
MRIGFDVAQTCVDKAGCGWYADALIRAMVKLAPENDYTLYHHFDGWINASTANGTNLSGPRITQPFRGLNGEQAQQAWTGICNGVTLPGDPQIVHANCFQAPKLAGTKLVFTIYDTSFWMVPEYTTEANRLLCQSGVLHALARADGFVFISQSSRDEFERVLPGWLDRTKRPWVVTRLGSKHQLPTDKIRSSSSRFWLAVGSLEPRKNYDTLLTAMELYWKSSSQRLPLKIAGGPGWKSEPLKQRLHHLSSIGIVSYLGYVPDEKLPDLYSQAAALIFPSWYEGFGLPVLEAMNHGCPVICSSRTSLPEVGGDAAIYVNPGSAEDIAQAMLALESDPGKRTDRSQASLRQAARFSWEQTASQTLAFYDRLLHF